MQCISYQEMEEGGAASEHKSISTHSVPCVGSSQEFKSNKRGLQETWVSAQY